MEIIISTSFFISLSEVMRREASMKCGGTCGFFSLTVLRPDRNLLLTSYRKIVHF